MNPAPYAVREDTSRGRRFAEEKPAFRSEFQRDRDRIVHSKAFRRLEYKTQVFVNHEGDLFRTRLTHSLEVAQISRTIARALNLNEDLSEAIALAHDLGHTPFGHAGQDALNACLRDYGGFEHNLQSLRVVDELEQRYADFDGLNLTFETREGILKHCTRARAMELGDVGERFVRGGQPSLEAQVANLADEIAYNNHDIDDGLRAGLISTEQLREVPPFRSALEDVYRRHPGLEARRARYEIIRRMINSLVTDLIEHSRRQLDAKRPQSVAEVRAAARPLVTFSDQMRAQNATLKRFLYRNLYRHYRVHRMNVKTQSVITALFDALFADPDLLPPRFRARIVEPDDARSRARTVADYIAGMTDRFALDEAERLHNPRLPA